MIPLDSSYALPMDATGAVVLIVSLLITVGWLAYFYR